MLPSNLPFCVLLQSNTAVRCGGWHRKVMGSRSGRHAIRWMDRGEWGGTGERFYVRSKVRKVKVNSMPEKTPRKRKWSRRRDLRVLIRCSAGRTGVPASSFMDLPLLISFSPCFSSRPSLSGSESGLMGPELSSFLSGFCVPSPLPRVSGNATARKAVSAVSRTSVRIAGAA